MQNFTYFNPVRVHFGPKEVQQVGLLCHSIGKKVLVVSYEQHRFLDTTLDLVCSNLKNEGLDVHTFYAIHENPDISIIKRGAELCKKESIDVVLAVGGGSVMDGTKAIAAGAKYPSDDLWNMVYARHDDPDAVPPEQALPTVMVPTLPATGSEMNMCSVVSNRELKEKSYIWSECLFPKVAIIDPELTLSLPPLQSACAAADAISHVLEIYINGADDTPVQHAFQEGVMRTVIANISKVLENPNDLEARGNLCWAATCAINGWASPGDAWTPIHQVGHVLTSQHGVNHGSSLTVLIPAWMKSFKGRRRQRYLDFATHVMGISKGDHTDDQLIDLGIQAFEAFLENIGVPTRLESVNIHRQDLDAIIDGVVKVSFGPDGTLNCNPKVTKEDLSNMLNTAL